MIDVNRLEAIRLGKADKNPFLVKELVKEIFRLRKVLEYYAEPKRYEDDGHGEVILVERGQFAREGLGYD